jgi:uncharacterized protein YkwD
MTDRTVRLVAILAVILLIISIILIVQLGLPALQTLPNQQVTVSTSLPPPQTPVQPPNIASGLTATSLLTPAVFGNDEIDGLVTLINRQRSESAIPPLRLDARLVSAAERYTADAAQQSDLNSSLDMGQLVHDAGYSFAGLQRAGLVTSSSSTADVFDSLWQTGNIRQLLLDSEMTDIGVTNNLTPAGTTIYTLVLAHQPVLSAPGSNIDNPGDASQSGQAEAILQLVNVARAANNAGPLTLNTSLTTAAAQHSADQAQRDTLGHDGSNGSTPLDRALAAGYSSRCVGENVLLRSDLHAAAAFDQWWNSDGHRENMMNPDFDEIGLAYAIAASNQYYYTMLLGDNSC